MLNSFPQQTEFPICMLFIKACWTSGHIKCDDDLAEGWPHSWPSNAIDSTVLTQHVSCKDIILK